LRAANSKPLQTGLAVIIIIALVFSVYPNTQAQNPTTFTPADKFDIPEQNGSISFATNGSYSSATLENGTWLFNDITLYNSSRIGNLKVSVRNSNITIFRYYQFAGFGQSGQGAMIRYSAKGAGQQTVNLDLNRTTPTENSEWSVMVPSVDGSTIFIAEGKDWLLLADDSVVVNGLTGNVTVANFGFTPDYTANLPFYLQHSIALITLCIVVATVATAAFVSYRTRRRQ
jgi:hypothetical protein